MRALEDRDDRFACAFGGGALLMFAEIAEPSPYSTMLRQAALRIGELGGAMLSPGMLADLRDRSDLDRATIPASELHHQLIELRGIVLEARHALEAVVRERKLDAGDVVHEAALRTFHILQRARL